MKNRKMLQRVAAVCFAAAMTVSLTACGGGSKGGSGAIKIGASGPVTGPAAVYGNAVKESKR